MNVTVYSKPDCPQCELTKRDLDTLGIAYETIDLGSNREQLNRLVASGYRNAPVVETDAGAWSGYDRDRIRGLATAG